MYNIRISIWKQSHHLKTQDKHKACVEMTGCKAFLLPTHAHAHYYTTVLQPNLKNTTDFPQHMVLIYQSFKLHTLRAYEGLN